MFDNDDFDKDFRRTQKAVLVYGVVGMMIAAGCLGFLGWCIVRLMGHYGIL